MYVMMLVRAANASDEAAFWLACCLWSGACVGKMRCGELLALVGFVGQPHNTQQTVAVAAFERVSERRPARAAWKGMRGRP